MTTETKVSFLEMVDEIMKTNRTLLSKVSSAEKETNEDEQKLLIDASTKLAQAGSKILESCKS